MQGIHFQGDKHISYSSVARSDFEQAYKKGFWRAIFSWMAQKENNLLPFDEVRQLLPFSSQHDMGMQQILIDEIIGSVNRYQDFDRAFLPRQTHTRDRWESIDKAMLQELNLPPIEVYQIGSVYFVKDGNHRVSVARERGQAYIDARVIAIEVHIPVDKNTNFSDLVRLHEYAEFNARTHLDELVPDLEFALSLPGQYTKLIEHIDVHRYFMGENQKRDISYNEAVTDWVEQVYLPLVRVIRENKMLDQFPDRTETDLYLWIIEHLWYLRQELREDVSFTEAAVHFTELKAPSQTGGLFNLIHKAAQVMVDGIEGAFGIQMADHLSVQDDVSEE